MGCSVRRLDCNIGYVIFNEAFWRGVVWSQAIGLLKKITRGWGAGRVIVIVFLPLINCLGDRKEIQRVRRAMSQEGVGLVTVPTPFAFTRYSHIRWFLLPLFLLVTIPALLFLTHKYDIGLLHSRAYPATFAALVIKMLRGKKVIFDPRSPFPEENVTASNWSRNSLTYKMWKRLEAWFLQEADCTIAISKPFKRYLLDIYPEAKVEEIPNNVDTEGFTFNREERPRIRKNHNWSEKWVIVYSGSIGGWNNPSVYAEYILRLRQLEQPHLFLFLIPRNRRAVRRLQVALQRKGVSPEEYAILHAAPEEVPRFLSAADIGLQVMGTSDPRTGVKFVEYLAMGLPVIVNSKVEGAAEYVSRFDLGLVLDLDDNEFIKKVGALLDSRERKERCREIAVRFFSNDVVASKYLTVYRELLESRP